METQVEARGRMGHCQKDASSSHYVKERSNPFGLGDWPTSPPLPPTKIAALLLAAFTARQAALLPGMAPMQVARGSSEAAPIWRR